MENEKKGVSAGISRLLGSFKKLPNNKKPFVLMGLCILGLLMILFSELCSGTDRVEPRTTGEHSYEDFEQGLEKRLTELVGAIEGAGRVRVMLTLASGEEAVYAVDEKLEDSSQKNSTERETTEKKDNKSERSHIIMDESGSDEGGLLIKTLKPQVRGVAVVCDGGDVGSVKRQIIQAVSSVLDLSTARISVAKMNP